MIISFSNIPLVLACVVGALILGAHVSSAVLKGRTARFGAFFAIFLHLALFVLLFFAGAEMSVMVLAFMASLFVYTLAEYISYRIKSGRTDK
jgi:hypothetical protein